MRYFRKDILGPASPAGLCTRGARDEVHRSVARRVF
jgi:hypothetical protein